jgi:hypothetical protein
MTNAEKLMLQIMITEGHKPSLLDLSVWADCAYSSAHYALRLLEQCERVRVTRNGRGRGRKLLIEPVLRSGRHLSPPD